MKDIRPSTFDVAVVGAGPVGTVTALAHARQGCHVLLIEANPKGAARLAGEWLHPAAVAILRQLGVDLTKLAGHSAEGNGFVTFADDGSDPVMLPYADGTKGMSCWHTALVGLLRDTAATHSNIQYLLNARVTALEQNRLTILQKTHQDRLTVTANRIVGADGRHSLVRRHLGHTDPPRTYSRMIGMRLHHVELPYEGYGHVFLGGLGPMLLYRIAPTALRLIADIPPDRDGTANRTTQLWEGFGPILPDALRAAFRAVLAEQKVEMAVNTLHPRTYYGEGHFALVGDAAGCYHPLTALGMTLGFIDAITLAECKRVATYARRRHRACRVPELIATGIYEAFSDTKDEAIAVRRSIFDLWRRSPNERRQTMRYLACSDSRLVPFARSFTRVMVRAIQRICRDNRSFYRWHYGKKVTLAMLRRTMLWISVALFHRPLFARHVVLYRGATQARDRPNRAAPPPASAATQSAAVNRGTARLLALQRQDGRWEGEVIWCPMLAAQYVMMCHITGTPLADVRRRLLLQFQRTRLPAGLWGLHAHAQAHLFVTALVYTAARLLGVAANDPLLASARNFFKQEGGVVAIPSWGKFWLAMLGLYEWRGVHPVLPECWALPRWLPLHPANFYCHTRLIYMAMAVIYGHKFQAALNPTLKDLRTELFPQGYETVNFDRARRALRPDDLYQAPSIILRVLYDVGRLVDRWHHRHFRQRRLAKLYEHMRWELKSSDHTSISPVSGLLNIIALWINDPDDPDLQRAMHRFEDWIWEDDTDGTRVTGARSASWDTAFALQTLAAVAPHVEVSEATKRGASFLKSQQINRSFEGYRDAYRVDPKGGWCFAGVWHGWPVSDCTAEAVSGLIAIQEAKDDRQMLADAAVFILQCQNRDGGFGSYEARKSPIPLEWLNPAEMFADSMTEHSYVECTASCLAVLAEIHRLHPAIMPNEIDRSMRRAATWLQRRQNPNGSWPAAWGVYFIYGTMFGVVGLRASGMPSTDPAIRKACDWLKNRQRADGGWGEHFSSCRTDVYADSPRSQVIQTAWALRTLLLADEPNWASLEKAAQALANLQLPDGSWPRQEMAGVFFRTALLDYELYRQYFPLWALGLYESRRKQNAQSFLPAGCKFGSI